VAIFSADSPMTGYAVPMTWVAHDLTFTEARRLFISINKDATETTVPSL
jgi:hypothetical protein